MSGRYTKEQQAEARRKWVEALRSGAYEQGFYALKTEGGKYCCLGVACEVAVHEGVIEPGAGRPGWIDTYYDGQASVLPESVRHWLGLADEAGSLTSDAWVPREHDPGARPWKALTELNDYTGADFDSIADLIEEGKVELE